MKLEKKATAIFGLRGTGKTTFAEHIADMYGDRAIIYDTVREYPVNKDYTIYRPQDSNSIVEFLAFINRYVKNTPVDKRLPKPEILLIDEGNRFAPGGGVSLHPALVDLNDQLRHPPYEIGVVWIARRPTQLHPDIIGLADNVLCFLLTGKNDIKYLNDLKAGYGDEVSHLKKYHSILFHEGQLSYVDPVESGMKGQTDAKI